MVGWLKDSCSGAAGVLGFLLLRLVCSSTSSGSSGSRSCSSPSSLSGREAHGYHNEVASSLVRSPLPLAVVVVVVHSPLLLGPLVVQ